MLEALIEIHHGGRWQLAGRLQVNNPEAGYLGPANFDYEVDYAAEHLHFNSAWQAVSCRHPIDFAGYRAQHWPAFMLDLLPTGAGRRKLLERHGLRDGLTADWELLLLGAGAPPGNLRISQAVKDHGAIVAPTASGKPQASRKHPGFSRDEVIERGEYFVEYAFQHGALTASASDVQGEAPKFLLVRDHYNRWHAEGAIDDAQVESHWLVKFPRGKMQDDRLVLKNEQAYLEFARALGLRVGERLFHEQGALFVPRFDRIAREGRVVRFGQESLCSAAGIAEFGAAPSQNVLADTIAAFSHTPSADIVEFIGRDLANVALGNKDNHARNSAFLKTEDGAARLSPIFDFAPMFLDPEMIPRVCRWERGLEQAGQPNWPRLVEHLLKGYPCLDADTLIDAFRHWQHQLEAFETIAPRCGISDSIVEMRLASVHGQRRLIDEVLRHA